METKKTITTAYNLILFAILLVFQTMVAVFEYKEEPEMLIDKLFEYDFFIGMILLVSLYIASLIIGVWITRSFWERFLSQIFHVRALTINEAVSIILVCSIFAID